MRIGERKEVGSGFVGADHYDRGFDHGAHRQGGFGDGLHLNRDLEGLWFMMMFLWKSQKTTKMKRNGLQMTKSQMKVVGR